MYSLYPYLPVAIVIKRDEIVFPGRNGKLEEKCLVYEVIKRCPDPKDTTSCFFSQGYIYHRFETRAAEVNYCGVWTHIYNFVNKTLVLELAIMPQGKRSLVSLCRLLVCFNFVLIIVLFSLDRLVMNDERMN